MYDIKTRMIKFSVNGEQAPGYMAQPDDDAVFPAVVVIQEWWGLDDHIMSVADRIAAEGYVAIAPDFIAVRSRANRTTRVVWRCNWSVPKRAKMCREQSIICYRCPMSLPKKPELWDSAWGGYCRINVLSGNEYRRCCFVLWRRFQNRRGNRGGNFRTVSGNLWRRRSWNTARDGQGKRAATERKKHTTRNYCISCRASRFF